MFKKNLVYLFVILAALLIQSSVFPAIFSFRPLPQILLMIVIAGTVISGFKKFLVWSIVAGALFDLFFYNRLGTEVIFFAAVTYFVSFFSRRFLVENESGGMLAMAAFVILATFFNRIFVLLSDFLNFGPEAKSASNFILLSNSGIEIICNLIIFFISFRILTRIEKMPRLSPSR